MISVRSITVLTAALLFIGTGEALAQGAIWGFGDSLLDTRRICPLLFAGKNNGFGTCSNGRGTLQSLPMYTGLSFNGTNNFAVGGSGTGPVSTTQIPPSFPNVDGQVGEFLATGQHISSSDLVVVSGFVNNAFALSNPAFTPTGLAASTLQSQQANISNLINAGARNVVVYGAMENLNFYSISGGTTPAGAIDYYRAVNAGLPGSLAPLQEPGTRVRILDLASVYERAYLNPRQFGFTRQTPCVSTPGCTTATVTEQNQGFLYDVHPTEAGHQLLARYISNLSTQADGIQAQADMAQIVAANFSGQLGRRLDSSRTFGMIAPLSNANAFAAYSKTPKNYVPAPAEVPISIWMEGSYSSGDRDTRVGSGGTATGLTYSIEGGTVGAEYKVNANVKIGAALNYSNSTANLYDRRGTIGANTYQFGGYVSFAYTNWFADVIATSGHGRLNIDRPGVVDVLTGQTSSDTWAIGGKAAYLFDIGKVDLGHPLLMRNAIQIGPLVALNYIDTSIDPYTEIGDPVLTQSVARQSINALTGGAGIQMRQRSVMLDVPIFSYVNLTLEHDFLGESRTIQTAQTIAPLMPIFTVADQTRGARTYGKIASGFLVGMSQNLAASFNTASTFGRGGGNDQSYSGGLIYKF